MSETGTLVDLVRKIAREHGYAIGEHGSKIRDIDLIAVPWTEEAVGASELVEAIAEGLGWRITRRAVKKPHGRLGYILRPQPGEVIGRPIDLSVMPGGGKMSRKGVRSGVSDCPRCLEPIRVSDLVRHVRYGGEVRALHDECYLEAMELLPAWGPDPGGWLGFTDADDDPRRPE